jgi:hypothetical protein
VRGARLLAVCTLFALLWACGGKGASAIAELTKADGPVEKQTGESAPWGGAKVGTKFYIGDAARTADGPAQLEVSGGAQIAMQPHTILRFGGTKGNSKIAVELGAIDLSGSGSYGLKSGDVKLSKGKVRITAGGVMLMDGEAQVTGVGGNNIDLVMGIETNFDQMEVEVTTRDAGVADAPVIDAPIDAPEVSSSDGAIEVTGKKAEIQLAGETTWKPLAAGAGALPKGAKVRLGAGTTAKITARGTTLDMAGGSRMSLGDDLSMALEGVRGRQRPGVDRGRHRRQGLDPRRCRRDEGHG